MKSPTQQLLEACEGWNYYRPAIMAKEFDSDSSALNELFDSTAAAIERAKESGPFPTWHCDQHPPTEPGVYYMENCDSVGNPRPGLMYLEQGKKCEPTIPTKYFGPIAGAMQEWPMVPVDAPAVRLASDT